MISKGRILVVDDEIDLCEILRFNLEAEGYEVTTVTSAEEALQLLTPEYCLIILDVMLERMSGFDMAKQLRQQGNQVPIIFLTALATENDLLQGFSLGGDDYITKPFSFKTVLARVQAVLKRTQGTQPKGVEPETGNVGNKLHFQGLLLDVENALVSLDGVPLPLTRKEFDILSLLLSKPDRYFTRDEILNRVWADDAYVSDRSVDVHIARLRKKLGGMASRVVSRTGYGYHFDTKN